MITKDEALPNALTQDEYDALSDEYGDVTFRLLFEQYAPSFSQRAAASRGQDASFDAITCGDWLITAREAGGKLTFKRLESEDSEDKTWSKELAYGPVAGTPISLAYSSGVVRAFYYTSGSLWYWQSVDLGINWKFYGTGIELPSTTAFVAASSLTRVHFVYYTDDIRVGFPAFGGGNWRLGVAEFNGSWSVSLSEVYWPFAFESFDAVDDIIVAATDFSPLIGYQIIGTQLSRKVERVTGIVIIKYMGQGLWSDHYAWDVVDIPNDLTRSQVRVTSNDSYYFLTYLRSDIERGARGTANRHRVDELRHNAVAVCRSGDGISWESPVTYTAATTAPTLLVTRGRHAYMLASTGAVHRSLNTAFVGDADTDVSEDLTNHADKVTSKAGQIRNSTLTLHNPADELRDTGDLLSPLGHAVQARLELGYYNYTEDRPVRAQVLVGDVVQMGRDKSLPVDKMPIGIRDRLALMNLIRADNAQEWQSVAMGADNYRDTTNTGYGGMRHTAVMRGAFKNGTDNTDDEESDQRYRLYSIAHLKESIAWQTFATNMLSGELAVCFALNEPPNDSDDEYAGIVFKAIDRNNLWALVYTAHDPSPLGSLTDRLWLMCRTGIGTAIDPYSDDDDQRNDVYVAYSTSPMLWASSPGDEHYIKGVWRYNLFRAFTSDDEGVTWDSVDFTWYGSEGVSELDGISDLEIRGMSTSDFNETTPILKVSGYAGVIAYGYSSTGAQDPPSPPPPPEPPDPVPVGLGDGNIVAIVFRAKREIESTLMYKVCVVITENFNDPSPTWRFASNAGYEDDQLGDWDDDGETRAPICIDFEQGGSGRYGLYVTYGFDDTYEAGDPPPRRVGDSAAFYNPDPLGDGDWSEVVLTTFGDREWRFFDDNAKHGPGAYVLPDPEMSGTVAINCVQKREADAGEPISDPIVSMAITDAGSVLSQSIRANTFGMADANALGWDEGNTGNIITAGKSGTSLWRWLSIPHDSAWIHDDDASELTTDGGYVIGYEPGDPLGERYPQWIYEDYSGESTQYYPVLPATGGGIYSIFGSTSYFFFRYGEEGTFVRDSSGAFTYGIVPTAYFSFQSSKVGQCPTLPGKLTMRILEKQEPPADPISKLCIFSNYLTTVTTTTGEPEDEFPETATMNTQTLLFGGTDDVSPYVVMVATDLNDGPYDDIEVRAFDLDADEWSNKNGNIQVITDDEVDDLSEWRTMAVFWGEEPAT